MVKDKVCSASTQPREHDELRESAQLRDRHTVSVL